MNDTELILAAVAAGAGAATAWRKVKPENDFTRAQTEAVAVNTLIDVVQTLREELTSALRRLKEANDLIEQLTGERLPDPEPPV